MTPNMAPNSIFDRPLEAASALVFGVLFTAVATLIHWMAQNRTWLRELTRHRAWFVMRHGRPMTDAELDQRFSGGLLVVARVFGRVAQVLGLLLMLAALTSLTRTFLLAVF